jgi:hypothetical protein
VSVGDKLIIAGAVTVPAVFAVTILTVTNSDYALASIAASVAVAAGLITTGILMRKNRS